MLPPGLPNLTCGPAGATVSTGWTCRLTQWTPCPMAQPGQLANAQAWDSHPLAGAPGTTILHPEALIKQFGNHSPKLRMSIPAPTAIPKIPLLGALFLVSWAEAALPSLCSPRVLFRSRHVGHSGFLLLGKIESQRLCHSQLQRRGDTVSFLGLH